MVFPTTRLLAQRGSLARRLRTARPIPVLPLSFAVQRYQPPAKRRHSIRTIATTRPSWAESTLSGDKAGAAASASAPASSDAPNQNPANSAPSTSTSTTSSPSPSTTKTSPSTTKASPSTTKTASPATPIKKASYPARPRAPSRTITPRATPSPSSPAPEPIAYPDVDWASSYYGVAGGAFSTEATAVLRRPLNPADVEIKPDGIVFLPEIKYRAILLEAFGAGGWGMVPKGEPIILNKLIVREWALIVNGRFVSQARGENNYFGEDQIPRAIEATKSNALMRCCKDLGVAAELWDKRYVNAWKGSYCEELWVEHVVSKKRARIFLKKGDKVEYPFKVATTSAAAAAAAARR